MSLKTCYICFYGFFLYRAMVVANPIVNNPQYTTLKYTPEFIFTFVLEQKKQVLNTNVPLPKIFYKSQIQLNQFQDAIAPQWGLRPNEISNAYVILRNEIYLSDEADYYKKTGRCMDDSLAHELTHYIQDRYQHFDLNDESLEWDAVEVQTAFREKFCPL